MTTERFMLLTQLHTEARKHAESVRRIYRHKDVLGRWADEPHLQATLHADLLTAIAALENVQDNITRAIAPPGNPPPAPEDE